MKLLKKTLVAAGIATAVFATGAAQAATINFPSTTVVVPAPWADTAINETVRTTVDIPNVIVQLAAGESLNVDDSITFTLSAGTFSAVGTVTASAGTATFSLAAGGQVGDNFATFRTNVANSGTVDITLSGAQATGTDIADNGGIMTTALMRAFVGGSALDLFGSPLTSLSKNFEPLYTATFTAAAGQFDVATGFTTLGLGPAPTTSGNGTVTVTPSVNATAGSTTAGVPAAGPTGGSQLISVSGPMAGVSAVSAASLTGSTSIGTATTPATAAGSLAIDTANNMAYGTGSGTHQINLTFDGTVSYDVSTYTANVASVLDAAGYTANASYATGATHSFTRNGSAFTTNSFGTLNKLTVSDRSGNLGTGGADGAIALSAFDAAGVAVTCTGLTIANVPNNGTTTIQGTDVLGACPGAKRIEGVVNSTTIYVTNTKITADGATSQSASNGGTQVDI